MHNQEQTFNQHMLEHMNNIYVSKFYVYELYIVTYSYSIGNMCI